MTTDKLYSGKFLIYKAVYAVLLPVLAELAGMLFDAENGLVLLFYVMFFMGLLYAAPFMLALQGIRREQADKKDIRRFMLCDGAFLLLPAIVSSVVSEAVFALFGGDARGLGFFSVLAICIFTLITLVFFFAYIVFKKK